MAAKFGQYCPKLTTGPPVLLCLREFRGTTRNTGNFHRHVKCWHPHLMRQVQEKKLERSVQLRKERILRKKIRNGHTPSNTAVNEEEEEQMEQMDKVEEVEEKLEKAEEELIITPYPSGDHTYAK
ncbi:hypothetical protein ACLKA7_009214 [Drosophila subpalustris]